MGCNPSKVNKTSVKILSRGRDDEATKAATRGDGTLSSVCEDRVLLPNAADVYTDLSRNESPGDDRQTSKFVFSSTGMSWSRHVEMSEMYTVRNRATAGPGTAEPRRDGEMKVAPGERSRITRAGRRYQGGGREQSVEKCQWSKCQRPTDGVHGQINDLPDDNDTKAEGHKDCYLVHSLARTPEQRKVKANVNNDDDGMVTSGHDGMVTSWLPDAADVDISPVSADSQYYSEEASGLPTTPSGEPELASTSSFLSWSETSLREDFSGSLNSLSTDDMDSYAAYQRQQPAVRYSRPKAAIRRRTQDIPKGGVPVTARF